MVLGPATHDGSQRRVEPETFGVVDILVAGQSAVDRLPQQSRQGVLLVLSEAGVVQDGRGRTGQFEGVVEFTIGEKSGIAGDGRAVEFQLELAVEFEAEGSFWLSPIGFLSCFGR